MINLLIGATKCIGTGEPVVDLSDRENRNEREFALWPQ
jgi:hypothetical protein